jgi:hypothetical protein
MQIKYLSFFVSLPFAKERRIQESLHNSTGNLLSSLPSPPPDEKLFTYEAFSKRNVQILEGILERNSQEDSLYISGAFETALASLVIPMRIKYDSTVPYSSENPPIWRFAVSSFVNVANVTLDSLGQKIGGAFLVVLI